MRIKNDILDKVIDQVLKGVELKKAKLEAAREFSSDEVIKNSELLARAKKRKLGGGLPALLQKKPTRTVSGVTPIAIMIKPQGSCIYHCIYCPKSEVAPKSYTGEEPAALRARRANFDPATQVRSRLDQYENIGHPAEKCELIIMGGTFLGMEKSYKEWFIKNAYDEMNEKKSKTLEEAKKINETARHRVVGLTVETRPDVCGKNEIDEMLGYGATRVELGVQHPDNKIYQLIKRGHTVNDVISATKYLKNAGFKVLYHIMPGIAGSNKSKDISMIKMLFSDPSFRPDMLKIYPTLVLKGTELFEMMKMSKYSPYSTEDAVDVISEFYRYIPKYVRIMRIQRDIPAGLIQEGVKNSNLRELVETEIQKKRIKIDEIRAREIGIKNRIKRRSGNNEIEVLENSVDFCIARLTYEASEGKEIFLSFENKNNATIAGFCRLRIPAVSHRREINEKSAIIRELRVFGQEAEIGESGVVQHQGIGKLLLSESESIAKEEFDKNKLVVISGVGAREYYYKKGYRLEGAYVVKDL